LKRGWLIPVVLLLLAACDQETATEAGAGLLPPGAIRTFEVVLEPERYLVFDSAFGLFTDPRDAPFVVVAREFEGVLNSNALLRFSIPEVITVTDTAGVVQLDTVPNYFAGTVQMQVDTTLLPAQEVQLALYRTAEDWDVSATWTLRVDTAGAALPWTTPGGTRGELVSRITVASGSDSIAFPVDSATIAHWREIADGTRGALIVAETPGVRLRTTIPTLHLQGRPSVRPDTVVTTIAAAPLHTWLFEPEQPTMVGDPRVGGTPAWRTVFQLRDRLDTLSFACPDVPNCRVPLGQAHINYAGMQLQPAIVPSGFRPEAPVSIAAYLMLPTPLVPLHRSPLGDLAGFVSAPATSFVAPLGPLLEIQLTDLIRLASLQPQVRGTTFLPTHFALVPGEPRTFGFAAFESMPPLRLVISIARELQLP
jgi:hypothetical protein